MFRPDGNEAELSNLDVCEYAQLTPYLKTPIPDSQLDAEKRRSLIRRGRSTKRRSVLLAQLEQRFRHAVGSVT